MNSSRRSEAVISDLIILGNQCFTFKVLKPLVRQSICNSLGKETWAGSYNTIGNLKFPQVSSGLQSKFAFAHTPSFLPSSLPHLEFSISWQSPDCHPIQINNLEIARRGQISISMRDKTSGLNLWFGACFCPVLYCLLPLPHDSSSVPICYLW